MQNLLYYLPLFGILGLVYVVWKSAWVNKQDAGTDRMKKIAAHIAEGAMAFLKAEYKVLSIFVVCVALLLGLTANSESSSPLVGVSFVLGAFCSALAGYVGVWVSVRVNIRVAHAASRFNYGDALLLAFRGGAISACLSASFCILGIVALYLTCSVIFVNYLDFYFTGSSFSITTTALPSLIIVVGA